MLVLAVRCHGAIFMANCVRWQLNNRMNTFNEFLKHRDTKLFSEIFGLGKRPAAEPAKEETPLEKYKRMSGTALKDFKPDTDKPKDQGEEKVMTAMRRSKKK